MAVKPAVTLSEGNGRQNNTDVLQGPPIVASRLITRLKAKQAPRKKIASIVHEEMWYTAKELNVFGTSFEYKSGYICGNKCQGYGKMTKGT